MSADPNELALLANMAYGESYYKQNNYEEMAAIASVLLRQRDARGYATMQAFTAAVPSYSFVVGDGNPRFNSIKKLTEAQIQAKVTELDTQQKENADAITAKNAEIASLQDRSKLTQLKAQLQTLTKKHKSLEADRSLYDGYAMAYKAAHNALDGGTDFSNGAYFWDGWDIKTNYAKHAKVKAGIKITSPEHNIFGIEDHLVVVIKYKTKVEKKNGKSVKTQEEVGRYDHVYESTAAHGGTIFWKFNPDYIKLTGASEFE